MNKTLRLICTIKSNKASESASAQTSREEQVILPDSLSEDDEAAISTMVARYQRARSATPEQLEQNISNYFKSTYGTSRSIYVVEFKSLGNGNFEGRSVYILLGNEDIKFLSESSGGFIAPFTLPKQGYAFENWIVNNRVVESWELDHIEISGNTIIYASFSPDTNGDGIPDNKQNKYNISFINADYEGNTLFKVFEPIDKTPCYVKDAIGFHPPLHSCTL